jgi:hypothetical protein
MQLSETWIYVVPPRFDAALGFADTQRVAARKPSFSLGFGAWFVLRGLERTVNNSARTKEKIQTIYSYEGDKARVSSIRYCGDVC